MATAQEILNTMEEGEEQNVIVIDSDLRTIRIPDEIKILGVESDDDVLRLHFKMPKMYGEFDLSTFALRVNYLNANGEGDVFVVQDAAANGDELEFSWLVGRTAAQYKGDVKFIVCAKKVKEGGIVEKEFNTTHATLPVLEGLETTERVAQENPDVIEAILLRLDKLEKNGGGAEPDATLTQPGKAADAKATGDALNKLKEADDAQDERLTALEQGGGGTGGTVKISPRMSNIIKAGTVFEKPEGLPYCGWPFNNVQYDPDINSIVFLINAAEKHGDNGKNVLHMGVMNLETYDVTIKEIGNPDTLGHGFYTMGFCINSAGEYLYVDAQSATLGKSVDKGVTWTETDISAYSNWPESLTQLSNGRYLFWSDGSNKGVWYSDNDCETWTQATMSGAKFEGDFMELPDGVVMCFMRKSTNGTDNGAWSGTKIKEPIVISISRDYGATWSAATDSVTLLEGCANIASAFYHADEDLVEVFTSPRYPFGDTYGAVFQYIATREDALNDKFGEPKVVLYSKAHAYQDFGHIGGCFDNLGNLHLMYYDGDGDASGAVNYHYLKASRGQATLPLVNDNSQSVFLPYSGNKVEGSIFDVYAYIRKVRNELLIKIGEMPDSGDSENPTYWITDGLIAQFDFSEDNFDSATSSFSVIGNDYKDAKLYTEAKDGVYSTSPLVSGTDTSVPLADLIQAAVLDPEAGYTIELDVGALLNTGKDETVISGNTFYSWGNEKLPSFSTTTARTYGAYAGNYWRGDNTRKASTISYVLDRVNKRSYLYINGALKLDSVNFTVEDGHSVDVADCYGISNKENWRFKTWASNFMELGSWDNKALRFYTRPLTAEEIAHNATYTNL